MNTGYNWDGYKEFWRRNFTIVNKDKIEVPFITNPAQDAFLQYCTLRNNILKARKLGFSSLLLAIAATKFLTGTNERCVSMSFDASASGKQLERAKYYIKSYERANQIKIPLKYNSRSELVYEGETENPHTGAIEKGAFMNSLRIGTAKSDSFGRGDDITFLHLTEVSFAKDINTLLTGVGEALVRNAMLTMETTANGFNGYKTFWEECVLGLRGYTPMFFSPAWEYSPAYLELKKQELKDLFYQEYPSTPEEAFIASGKPYIEKLAMKKYLDEVQGVTPMGARNG